MMFPHRLLGAIGMLTIALGMVGCQTMTGRSAGRYIDDQTITAEVKSKLIAERFANLTRVNVTTQNAVVYLTGTADSSDRAQRAADLAQSVEGVRQVVNQIQIASTSPAVVVSAPTPSSSTPTGATAAPSTGATAAPSTGATAAPSTGVAAAPSTGVAAAPATAAAVPAGHPPVDVTGRVARYDAQTGVVTFEDGRMVQIPAAGLVWQSARASDVQPGQQIYVRNAVPVGLQPAIQGAGGSWHFGTVSRVDTASNVLYLTDGTAVQIQPSTRLMVNGQPIALSQVLPGTEVGVLLPARAAATTAPSTSTTGVYALPRSTTTPMGSSQILIFNAPSTR